MIYFPLLRALPVLAVQRTTASGSMPGAVFRALAEESSASLGEGSHLLVEIRAGGGPLGVEGGRSGRKGGLSGDLGLGENVPDEEGAGNSEDEGEEKEGGGFHGREWGAIREKGG